MKNLTIDRKTLEILFENKETREVTYSLLKKCKYSKYGYNGDSLGGVYFYCEVDPQECKNLLALIYRSETLTGVAIEFIHSLIKIVG